MLPTDWGTITVNGACVKQATNIIDMKEYRRLLEQIPDQGLFVELGVFDGGSLAVLADTIKRKRLKLLVADLFLHAMTDFRDKSKRGLPLGSKQNFIANMQDANLEIIDILGNSQDIANWLHGHNEKADFIYIDADHSYEGMQRDLGILWPTIKEGGTLGGHDYNPQDWPGVIRAVNEKFPTEVLKPSNPPGIVNIAKDGFAVWSIKKQGNKCAQV